MKRSELFGQPSSQVEAPKPTVSIEGINIPVFNRPRGQGTDFADDHFATFQGDSSSKAMLEILARDEKIARTFGRAISPLIQGPTDIGKTTAVEYYAHATNRKLVRINCNNQTDVSDLIGKWVPSKPDIAQMFTDRLKAYSQFFADESAHQKTSHSLKSQTTKLIAEASEAGRDLTLEESMAIAVAEGLDLPVNTAWVWQDGDVVKAMERGDVLYFDEINAMKAGVRVRLQSLFEDRPKLSLQENGGRSVIPVDGFYVISTQNPPDGKSREVTRDDQIRRHDFHIVGELTRGDLSGRYQKSVGELGRLPKVFKETLLDFHLEVKRLLKAGQLAVDQKQSVTVEFAWLKLVGQYLGAFEESLDSLGAAEKLLTQAVVYCYANKFESDADRQKILAILATILNTRQPELKAEFAGPKPVPSPEEIAMQAQIKDLLDQAKDADFSITKSFTPDSPPSPKSPKTIRRRSKSPESSSSRLPDYWTEAHTTAINEALGFKEGELAQCGVPTLEEVDDLSDVYKDKMYPVKQPKTDKYISKRPDWFGTEWPKYKEAMLTTIEKYQGCSLFLDATAKPSYTDGTQTYRNASGKDPLQKHLETYFGSSHRFSKSYELSGNIGKPIGDLSRKPDILGFLHYIKQQIIKTLESHHLSFEPEDIIITLPPATLMNQLMTSDTRFQSSSQTNTWEWTSDELGTGGVLMVGHSVDGGASGVDDVGRGETFGIGGFRPAVIVRKSA